MHHMAPEAVTLASAARRCLGADTKAILWQPPGEITLRDWTWGPGGQASGQARAPQSPFEFVEEDFKGTNVKVKVRDAKGDHWIVKFGGENHGGVFGSRLLYAFGYLTEPTYFSGSITRAHNLKRAKGFIARDGAFSYARFKLRDHKALTPVEDEGWSWNDNPFVGTRELNGLKILVMLTSNWDAKDARDGTSSNTAIYTSRRSGWRYYAFNDWGATMGRWGASESSAGRRGAFPDPWLLSFPDDTVLREPKMTQLVNRAVVVPSNQNQRWAAARVYDWNSLC